MTKSRWNRSRVYRERNEIVYKIGDLVLYHWTQRYSEGRPDDELCVVIEVEEHGLSLQPVDGECAFLASKSEVTYVA